MKARPSALSLAALLPMLLVGTQAHGQTLTNPGFETPDKGASGWEYTPSGTGWSFPAQSGISGPNGPWRCNSTSPDPLGDQFAFLQRDTAISQTLTGLIVGGTYELSFYESYRTGTLPSNDLSVIIDEGLGSEATIYNNPNITIDTWQARTTSQLIATATSHTVTFRATDPLGAGDRTTIIDGVTITTVALPGTPTVTGLSPADDAGAVAASSELVLTFDRNILEVAGKTITIKDLDSPADTVITLPDAQVSVSGAIVTITPDSFLAWSTNYAVQVEAGAFEDAVGNAYVGIADNTTWNFTTDTADLTGPAVVVQSPADDSTGVGRQTDLVLTVDENAVKGSGNIVIKRVDDGSTVETIDVNDAAVTLAGTVLSIDRSVILDRFTEYYVEIDAGAIEDVYGNSFAGISGSTAWSFTSSAIYYLPISGDADSGISSSKVYTHAIDFGNNVAAGPVATINGVVFANGGLGAFPAIGGSSQTVGTGTSNFGNTNSGNDGAAPFLADAGVKALVRDMIFNPTTGQQFTLTGLTPGQAYEIRLYNRVWGAGDRGQNIGFSTDGVGTDLSGAEDTGIFEQDNATSPEAGFATATQVNALSFEYTLPTGVTELTVFLTRRNTGSYHLYGLTNEEATDPALASTVPADDAINVSAGANLEATFAENIVLGSGTITIKNLDDASDMVITLPDPQVSVSGSVLTINPTAILLPNKNYAIQMDAGVVADVYGNLNDAIADNTTWNFLTDAADITAPTLASQNPTSGTVDLGRDTDLVLTLNEDVQKGTGNIVLRRLSDDSVVETIDVNSANVTISGAEVTISFTDLLESGVTYYLEIDNGALEDLSANAFAGISGSGTWTFTATEVEFILITGDADSGIDIGKEYTHAIDFGNNTTKPTATINGVVFADGGAGAFPAIGGSSQTVGTGTSNIPDSHPGNNGADALLTAGGMQNLVGDMIYNNLNAQIDLTGLTPGVSYQVRLYHRAWDTGPTSVRRQDIGFNTDGVAGPEATATFDEDHANLPDPGMPADGTVNAVSYDYVAPASGEISINIDRPASGVGSYHLYGLTNEALDAIPPLVTGTDPADDATGVEVYANLQVSFDDQMLPGTGNITLKNLDTMSDTVIPVGDAQVTVSGNTVTINPDVNLAGSANYAVWIDAGALTDTSGNDFAGIADDTTWNFTTAPTDMVDPMVVTFAPADDATNVDPTTDLVITFDEDVVKGTGNIVIKEDGSGTTIETIDVNSGAVTVSGTEVTINPAANLASNGSYYVEVDAGALKDPTGNTSAAITGATAWNIATRDALVLRLEAANYDDVAGTWTDTSGLGNHATAPIAPDRPAKIAAQTGNGSAIVSFDGTDYLDLTSNITPLSDAGGYTAFVYLRPQTDLTGGKTFFGGDPGAFQYRLKGLPQNVVRQQQAETGISSSSLPFGSGAVFSSINVQGNDAGGIFRLNGADDGTLSGSTYPGAIHKIGTRAPLTEFYIGDIAEIRIYDRQLSLAEIQTVEDELEAAYGASAPYDLWAVGYLPANVNDQTGNNDGDALVNLLEFGFGTNPTVSDSVALNPDGSVNGLPIAVAGGGGGGVSFKAFFVRRDDHGTSGSVTYTPQFSGDLVTFYDSTVTPTVEADSTVDADYEVVSVPYPAGLLPDDKKARFYRVKVTVVP